MNPVTTDVGPVPDSFWELVDRLRALEGNREDLAPLAAELALDGATLHAYEDLFEELWQSVMVLDPRTQHEGEAIDRAMSAVRSGRAHYERVRACPELVLDEPRRPGLLAAFFVEARRLAPR